jgi:DNA-binding IclR family transcriptional regulator
MSLPHAHLQVLAALEHTQRTGPVSARAVAQRVGMSPRTVRVILRTHARRGLAVQQAARIPAVWAITSRGHAVISEPRYQDYIDRKRR